MDDTQRIVKCGNLSLHSPGGFFKKRWHSKYLVLYDGSKSGVKRLELFDSEIKFKKQNPAKIIPLVDCVRVVTCQRHKTTYTFEVRTNDQSIYLLAAQSFQDMNDWVNCLRLVAFGQSSSSSQAQQQASLAAKRSPPIETTVNGARNVDVLLEKRAAIEQSKELARSSDPQVKSMGEQSVASAMGGRHASDVAPLTTARQAAAAAASALAKTRQRQPSLLGSCKPQPPTDSPFIQQVSSSGGPPAGQLGSSGAILSAMGAQMDTLTPSVRGQLISNSKAAAALAQLTARPLASGKRPAMGVQATLDEEEENMLYCSIEDNPSEHNYRVKVIETELSLRCQLKCYQLTAPTTISQQYEQLGQFNPKSGAYVGAPDHLQAPVTFYQLIIGPQELTLLNDYASAASNIQLKLHQQQGLWSWPYQCIRRYGFDKDNCFMFEAGRKCGSGPGQFVVQTPKAYQIYQDVVKFVNELRSLNSIQANGATKQNAFDGKAGESAAKTVVVTQIPVTWAPNSVSTPNIPTSISQQADSTSDSRQQFFDTLRQLDSQASSAKPGAVCDSASAKSNQQVAGRGSSSSQLAGQSTLSSTTTSHDNRQQQQQQAESPILRDTQTELEDPATKQTKADKSCPTAATSEETDESGYEQGDDSVDSSTSRFRLAANAARKRQANDSMSSASSTSSGGSSPGHSVGRRSGAASSRGVAFGGQGPTKRPPLNTGGGSRAVQLAGKCQEKPTSTINNLRNLITESSGRQPEDFETNLIRDVYSEITKLHAKFAVTSGSAEDLMSNNSSNEESNSDGSSNSSSSNESRDDSRANQELNEPMYSNLGLVGVRDKREDSFEEEEEDGCLESRQSSQINKFSNQPTRAQQLHNNYQHDQRPTSNSYSQCHFDYPSSPRGGPLYPTMLNPIPECGETPNAPPTSLAQKQPQKLTVGRQNYNLASDYAINIKKQSANRRQLQVSSSIKSRLPTNHYVINDVQYAKISRNIRSNYESCL